MEMRERIHLVAVDLRATVPKATPADRRPEVDGYLSEAIYAAGHHGLGRGTPTMNPLLFVIFVFFRG